MRKITKRRFLGIIGLLTSLLPSYFLNGGAKAREVPRGKGRLLQGPMPGAVSPHSIRIWLRASNQFPISIEYATHDDFCDARKASFVRPDPTRDYSAVLEVDGLRPDTRYFYRVMFDGKQDPFSRNHRPYQFKTAPLPESARTFTVAVGSCAHYARDAIQPIWLAVARHNPDLFFWLGDNIYGDSESGVTLADEYQRQREVENYRAIGSRIPQLAIWDDHDFGFNNSDRTNPFKKTSLQVFRNYWANPAFGTEDMPGVFFDYSYGGVDFFFLDIRYYRDPNGDPDGTRKSMLGSRQKDWLKQKLASSVAPFKVLLSGSSWTLAKGPGGDGWSSFLAERNELFEFIRKNSISGVVLVSGDTHVAELNAVPWSENGGYDYYDLTSSPLAQIPASSWLTRAPELRIRQVYFGSPNFGLLTFTMQPEPVLAYNAIDHYGKAVWETFQIYASELQNGVESWKEKMDDLSRTRHERVSRGEPYYR